MAHVLVHAEESHLIDRVADRACGEQYWNTPWKPQNCECGEYILFSNGGFVIAAGVITGVEDGRLWFTPLQRVGFQNPVEPPEITRIKYFSDGDLEAESLREKLEQELEAVA